MTAPIRSLGLWWLRRDLRTADNEALTGACRQADAVLPVFCFDPRDVQPRRETPEGLGVPKLGPLRCRFLLEGLVELRREVGRLQAGGTPPPAAPQVVATEAGVANTDDAAAAAAAAPAAGGSGGWAAKSPEGAYPVPAAGGGGGDDGDGSSGGGGDGGGGGGGGGGGLVVRFGRTEEVLPRLMALVAAHNPQLRHVSLHHHLDLLGDSVELEGAVAGRMRDWAARQGVSISVHTYWDRTLYHPDDLPYHRYGKAGLAASQEEGAQRSRRSAAGAAGGGSGSGGGPPRSFSPLPLNADPDRFRAIPAVMTDFRKATQSAASVRASLPAPTALPPLPPPFSSRSAIAATATATAAAAATEPNEGGSAAAPAAAAAAAAGGGGWGEIPRTVGQVYDAAPGGRAALQRLEELVGLDYGELLPPLEQDGPPAAPDPRTAFPFHAGQENAVQRLWYYVWGHSAGPQLEATNPRVERPTGQLRLSEGAPAASPPSLLYFTNTRAQAVGVDNSTKLSPYVALGCITPRQIHEEVERVRAAAAAAAAAATAEQPAGDTGDAAGAATRPETAADGCGAVPPPAECDWLAMHLCIRDFFICTVLKEGDAVLDERGIVGRPVSWRSDLAAFSRWACGRTGLPFVDANMRELAASGWMSNRGRQNVACMLSKDLGVDWRWGAELFESLLLDCDVAVNYCNWNYFSGIGNDPRNRHFKTVTQGIQYDEDAVLAATWLPELAHLPPALRHQPWGMTEAEAEQYGVVLGRDYPAPMVDPANHVGQLIGTGKRKPRAKTTRS